MTDSDAVSRTAVEATATDGRGGVAKYRVKVPAKGSYQLCFRLRTSSPGQSLRVTIDDGPNLACPLAEGPDYRPHLVDPPVSLKAGKHTLTVVLPQPGARLDLLELFPRLKDPTSP